jgi:LysR family glycine cleavage system transcriptional activator
MKTPPLNALRAFESAGRQSSFRLAAAELHVTPGAISRQVALLEAHLGAPLFYRANRQVQLTRAGTAYLRAVSAALREIELATDEFMASRRRSPLHIWCPMTFGMRWLVPRLPQFRARHLEREVVFTTALGHTSIDFQGTDVAIRIGHGEWPDTVAHRIAGIELMPVCSPGLLAEARLREPRDLASVTLLQSSARPGYWHAWLRAAGVSGIDPDRGMTFESVSLAYQMAIDGAGVAMGQHALVAADLAAGRLVAPFGLTLGLADAFWLIYPRRLEDDPFIGTFRDWLLGEAALSETQRLAQLDPAQLRHDAA